MKSIPASSAMHASCRQSAQLADQRSGTVVAERPEEQLAPNIPILSAFALYMSRRARIDSATICLTLGSLETEISPRPYTIFKGVAAPSGLVGRACGRL